MSSKLESGNLTFSKAKFHPTSESKDSATDISTGNHIGKWFHDLVSENDCLKLKICELVELIAIQAKKLADSKADLATMEVTINGLNNELATLKAIPLRLWRMRLLPALMRLVLIIITFLRL
jgi:hypothetical protein